QEDIDRNILTAILQSSLSKPDAESRTQLIEAALAPLLSISLQKEKDGQLKKTHPKVYADMFFEAARKLSDDSVRLDGDEAAEDREYGWIAARMQQRCSFSKTYW